LAPNVVFWFIEFGLRLYWQFLFPAFVLPRIFPALTAKRVLGAALISRGVLLGLNWLLTGGLFIVVLVIAFLTGTQ
jgi:hypothetical protein